MFITLKSISQEKINSFLEENKNEYLLLDHKNQYIYKAIEFYNNKIVFYTNLTFTIEGSFINETVKEQLLKHFLDERVYIGSDEVGIGEAIGPIVVCAVTFNNLSEKKEFFLKGLIDSKKMNYKKINEIGFQIKNELPHKCIVVPVKAFNDNYADKNVNIKTLNAVLHNKIHSELGNKFQNRISVVDEFASMSKYKEYIDASINDEFYNTNYIFLPKAENQYLEVAAASILAKYTFNKYIVKVLSDNNVSIDRYVKNNVNYNAIANDINKKIITINDDLIKIWKK